MQLPQRSRCLRKDLGRDLTTVSHDAPRIVSNLPLAPCSAIELISVQPFAWEPFVLQFAQRFIPMAALLTGARISCRRIVVPGTPLG